MTTTAFQKEYRGFSGIVRLNHHVLFKGTASACERFAEELLACGGITELGFVSDDVRKIVELMYKTKGVCR